MASTSSNQVIVITSASWGTGLITVFTAAEVGGQLIIPSQCEPTLKYVVSAQATDVRH